MELITENKKASKRVVAVLEGPPASLRLLHDLRCASCRSPAACVRSACCRVKADLPLTSAERFERDVEDQQCGEERDREAVQKRQLAARRFSGVFGNDKPTVATYF